MRLVDVTVNLPPQILDYCIFDNRIMVIDGHVICFIVDIIFCAHDSE